MRVLARHERGGGGDERQVARRQVARDLGDAARQDHRPQERQAPRIGFALRELEQAHPVRLGCGDEHRRVDLAAEQRHHRRRLVQVAAPEVVALELVRGEELRHQAGRAAAARADIDLHALQRRELRQGTAAAVEDPYRLVEEAAERDELGACLVLVDLARRFARAALDERHIDLALRLAKEAQVLERAARGLEHHLDAVAGELGLVALAELRVGAELGPGREHHAPRRRRIEQDVGDDEQGDADEDERSPGEDQLAQPHQRLAHQAHRYAATFLLMGALGSQDSPGSSVKVNSRLYASPFFS